MPTRNLQKGAVAPLVAVLLLVIMVCIAFVIDLGHIHNVKVELQRAVDAAALAAARQLPDEDNVDTVARAVAATNTVDNAPVPVDEDQFHVEVGLWRTDADSYGRSVSDGTSDCVTPTDRWNSKERENLCGFAPNAVLVRATRDVEHAFFFFINNTEVVADAIALAQPINPVLPLTLISCIPTSALLTTQPGSLPGTGVCDIRYFTYTPDTNDTAAWTSLTFDANANDINAMLEGPAGRVLFEQVVFGRGIDNNGIENTVPDPAASPSPSYTGCYPQDLNINCGLGEIAGKDLAPPEDFPIPPGFPSPPVDIVPGIGPVGGSSFDPMTGYGLNQALPRWYNVNSVDNTFKTDDHFTRVWTLDGIMLKKSSENLAAYQTRLMNYYNGTETPPAPFDDGRLNCNDADGECLIRDNLGNAEKQAIADIFGVNKNTVLDYWPDYQSIIEHAGYPKVGVTNGTAAALLDTFLSNPEVATGEFLNCGNNDNPDPTKPPQLGGHTLKLQVPVIFAGFCESWKALSHGNENHELHYIGLADFYVTRAWKNPVDYACADNFVSGISCGTNYFDPPLGGSGLFSAVNENAKGIEGLWTVPVVNDAVASSLVRVLLVE